MPLKYVPKACTIPKLDQINTPNKNIQSYFMRTDASYYVSESHRMCNYRSDESIVQIIISKNKLIVESMQNLVNLDDFFYLTSMNKDRFRSLEEAVGWLGNKIYGVVEKLGIVPKNSFVSLVFHDMLNRTEVLALCNVLVNFLSFRGILVTPHSLSQAIVMLCPNCVVINLYEGYSTICLVEDFWALDTVSVSSCVNTGFNLIDSEDFVDEFNRIKVFEEKNIFLCERCDYKDDSESKVRLHFAAAHKEECSPEGGHSGRHVKKYEIGDDIYESVVNRMQHVLSREKMKRIGSKVLVFSNGGEISEDILKQKLKEFDVQAEVLVHDASMEETILSGMAVFSDLECVKDMWLTDKEWNSAGLRMLKEKVLFIV